MKGKVNLLITGGAGFIGSNLVEYFLKKEKIGLVRVLDDLSNGSIENIEEFIGNPRFEFVEGDIVDYETCVRACKGMHLVSHQAALGSVPRSIENPKRSTEVNILGTVNVMQACVQEGIQRIVFAFSSSTYGDHPDLPKVEHAIGNPLSPYAVTKASNEQFASVFGKTYGLDWVGLRYFNVFGPKQSPDNPYAAVIPIICKACMNGAPVTIFGDGLQSRDFTFVSNAVQANELALFTENEEALNHTYNVACGSRTNLNELISFVEEISGEKITKVYAEPRPGDVKHSHASLEKISDKLGYQPGVDVKLGLELVYKWYLDCRADI